VYVIMLDIGALIGLLNIYSFSPFLTSRKFKELSSSNNVCLLQRESKQQSQLFHSQLFLPNTSPKLPLQFRLLSLPPHFSNIGSNLEFYIIRKSLECRHACTSEAVRFQKLGRPQAISMWSEQGHVEYCRRNHLSANKSKIKDRY
jgi:hypothetical protein